MPFDITYRHRRLRRTPAIRQLFTEVHLHASDLIAPLFVQGGSEPPIPVTSMPGVFRFNLQDLVTEVRELWALGIRGVALFPVTPPPLKDATGTEALNLSSLGLRALRAVKTALPLVARTSRRKFGLT